MEQLKPVLKTAVRERLVLFFAGINVVYLSWSLGGVVSWTLHLICCFSLCALFFSIIPLPTYFNGKDGSHGNSKNLIRLLSFPFFWLGLIFVAYVTLQNLNPGYALSSDERGWWVEPVSGAIAWLPAGMSAVYEPMNGWRVLVKVIAAVALCCGIWVGLRRRSSLIILLWLFVFSGVAMGFLAIFQKITHAEGIFWSIPSENEGFLGTFFYGNQGAAYLNLVFLSATFLYFYHSRKTEIEGRGSGPHLLFFSIAFVPFSAACLAVSRGAFIVVSLLVVIFLFLILIKFVSKIRGGASLWVSLILCLILGGGLWPLVKLVDWNHIEERLSEISTVQIEDDVRYLAANATLDMASDKIWLGWGAGSYRYIFPMYQQKYPRIFYYRNHPRDGWTGRRFFRYAHNDPVQALAEYGIAGSSVLWVSLLAMAFWVMRSLKSHPYAVMMLIAGVIGMVAHSTVEFIFQSPAFMVAFCFVLAASAQLLSFERQRE